MKIFKIIVSFVFFLTVSLNVYSQEKKYKSDKVSTVADRLEEGIKENNDKKTADAFYELGKEYEKINQFQKALYNYKKAEELYRKLNETEVLSDVIRKIAKIEETFISKPIASKSYEEAQSMKSSSSDYQSELNDIDKERTKKNTTPAKDEKLINEKINILNSPSINNSQTSQNSIKDVNKSEELYDSYIQLANNLIRQRRYDDAISNLKNAQSEVINETDKIVSLNSEISDLYLKSDKPEKAIETQLMSLDNPQIKSNPAQKVKVIEKLSDIFLGESNDKEGLKYLLESYNLAIESGQTLVARDLMLKLEEFYKKNGKSKEALILHNDFLINLDEILAKDSSIIDEVKLKAAEQKIEDLEKEKELKDNLITKQNLINYLLVGGIVLLIVFLYFIFKAFQKAERSSRIIELQSLRKEMNPHFIFNSLNSINQFISNRSEMEANSYLTKFSTLMRSVLDNSNKNFILLQEEIELIKNYLELEHQRFNNHFDYNIIIDENIDIGNLYIPNMVIQPYIENAIWHGLRYKNEKGVVTLSINLNEDNLIIVIEDNGIGITESQKLKTEHQKNKSSVSTNNINKRIELLNQLYQFVLHSKTENLYQNTGTRVTLSVPFYDTHYLKTKWKKGLEPLS